MNTQYVVIGAGLAGAATAWQLARQGHEVTLVERTRPAAHDGSSHGSARIFRYPYPDRLYVELAVRARSGFDELEILAGQQLITPTGSLDFGAIRNPRALGAVLAEVGVEHELLSQDEARARFPQIATDTEVLWHPGAGVIDAETTVNVMVAAAVAAGAQVCSDWPVGGVTANGSGYRIHSDDGRSLDTDRVVVAAGGWLPTLLDRLPLPEGFRAALPRFEVSQENAYHFPYRDPGAAWPTFIHKDAAIQTYSLPGGRDAEFRGQKLAEYNAGRKMSTAAQQTGTIDPANRDRVIAYVERYLPGLVPEPYAETTCLFTNTPTEDFLIDTVDGITIVSACSGHGAKFAPVIGELAAAASHRGRCGRTGPVPGPGVGPCLTTPINAGRRRRYRSCSPRSPTSASTGSVAATAARCTPPRSPTCGTGSSNTPDVAPSTSTSTATASSGPGGTPRVCRCGTPWSPAAIWTPYPAAAPSTAHSGSCRRWPRSTGCSARGSTRPGHWRSRCFRRRRGPGSASPASAPGC